MNGYNPNAYSAGYPYQQYPNYPSYMAQNPQIQQPQQMPYATGLNGWEMQKRVFRIEALSHEPKRAQKKLETYAKELGRDILEMIEESTPEEKQIMQQKLSVLANKLK